MEENKRFHKILNKYKKVLSETEGSSYTIMSGVGVLFPVLDKLRKEKIEKIVDFGVGYGGILAVFRDYLGAKESWGIDLDDERLKYAEKLGHKVIKADFTEPVSLPKSSFDLVLSFGALEHSHNWDGWISNVVNVLRKGGYLVVSMPNLSSWLNRLLLLLGYQPRDLEISEKKAYGIYRLIYRSAEPINHVKISTFNAFKEFLNDNGFKVVNSWSVYRKETATPLDLLLSPFPSLSRRFLILAKKVC